MSGSATRDVTRSVSGNVGIVPFTHEIRLLSQEVGPAWGLAFLIAICIFLPRFGLAALFLRLLKEDRADDRRHKTEREKLSSRYGKRPTPLKKIKPKAIAAPKTEGDDEL